MEIKGKVYEVGATIQVTDNIKKRDLILEYIENPQYPEYLKFEAIQDRCALLDAVKPGQDIEVFFNLKGRKWTDKMGKVVYFNTLQVWKVVVLGQSQYAAPDNLPPQQDDDLPF